MSWKTLIPALLLTLVMVSCSIEPPLHLRQAMKVIVKVLWKAEIYPEGLKPTGVTLYFFRDGQFYMQHTTAQVDSCTVSLEPGHYQLYMISLSPEEYGMMEFDNMEDFKESTVRVTETRSRWYTRGPDETLINNPELMVAGVSEEFDVTEDMVRYQIAAATTKASSDEDDTPHEELVHYYTIRIPVYPKSIVSQYWVTIYSSNADVLKSVRASTSGMARNFLLTQDKTGNEEGTQFITDWTLTMDDPESRVGHLDGRITTFGFPRGELPDPQRDSSLNVAALLIDNETVVSYSFYVGDAIRLEEPVPQGHRYLYRLVFGSTGAPAIHPPDVTPPDEQGKSWGFDATVSDWEDAEDVDVLM